MKEEVVKSGDWDVEEWIDQTYALREKEWQAHIDAANAHLGKWGLTPASEQKLPRPRRRNPRKLTLAHALREARKAGVNVAGATLEADGKLSLQFGEAAPAEAANPWLAELNKGTKQ